jgi:hypothetical protein
MKPNGKEIQVREWIEEAERLKSLDWEAQLKAVAMIRALGIGNKGRLTAERRARYLEKVLCLKKKKD